MHWKTLCVLSALAPSAWAAQAMPYLQSFADNLNTMEAGFSQVVEDANGRILDNQSGSVKMHKPGKFNWHYQEPYEQKIVADGERLWFYDIELEQVTVRPLDQALGTAPIALLTSDTPLDEQFAITDLGLQGQQYMLQLEPRVNDTDYSHALIGLSKAGHIEVMQLKDPLGQITTITFYDVILNRAIPGSTFRFEVPEGVDVTGG